MTRRNVRYRFWIEAICAVLGSLLLVLTLISREWIEAVFGVDPDGGSGSLEFGLAIGLLAIAAVSGFLARREWRLAEAQQ